MPKSLLAWTIGWIALLYNISSYAAGYTRQFELRMSEELSNDESFVIEIATPTEEKIIALRTKVNALDDKDFKDQIKPTKFYSCNKKSSCFLINRQFLHTGQYIIEAEIDYKKVRLFNWLNHFESAETKKIFLKFEVEQSLGDE